MNTQLLRVSNPFSSLITVVFAVFFVLLPLIYTHQLFETASAPRHILITTIACLLLFIYLIQSFVNKIEYKYSVLHLIFFIFFCWALLSSLWSDDIKNSITELTQLFVYFIFAFFASQIKTKEIKIIFIAIYIGSSIAALIGILQAFNLNPLELKTTTPLASTFNNKNHASVFFDLVIPLALISMLTTKGHEKYIASIAYTLAVTFIFLAKTKGSLLGYFIFSLFFWFFIYKNKTLYIQFFQKKRILHYLFLSFIIPLIISSLTGIIGSNIPKHWNTDLTDNSASVRLSWYKNAYAMFKDHPINGVGYGSFRQSFALYASKPNIVKSITEDQAIAQLHNDPYQIFLELGLIGGGLIILIFSFIVFKGAFLLSRIDLNNKGSPNYILLACFLALISSITHSFVDFPMRLPSSAVLFWFITGITIVLIDKSSNKPIKYFQLSSTVGIILLISSFFFSWHSLDLYQRYFSASKLTYDASVSIQKENNCSKALKEIDQALNLFFEDAFIRQRYVQIYTHCNLPSEEKLEAMNRVLNYDGTNARARLSRASLYLDNNKLKLASIDFKYLIYVLPHRPAAYIGLADIATLKKDYKNARKYYEKAISLDPKNQQANYMLKQFMDKGI